MKRTLKLGATAAALVLVASGCGSDDGDSDASEGDQLGAGAAMGAEHDHAGVVLLGRLDDPLPDRIAMFGDGAGVEAMCAS